MTTEKLIICPTDIGRRVRCRNGEVTRLLVNEGDYQYPYKLEAVSRSVTEEGYVYGDAPGRESEWDVVKIFHPSNIHITPEDDGRKVRCRNGQESSIAWDHNPNTRYNVDLVDLVESVTPGGEYQVGGGPHPLDVVEWVEESVTLTKADVGKQVRLRNGSIDCLESFTPIEAFPCPFKLRDSGITLTVKGRHWVSSKTSEYDVMEVLGLEPEAPQPAGALKYDTAKPPLSLIPRSALEAEARVMATGAAKYGRDNWRQGMDWTRLADAALRHLHAWVDGEDLDEGEGGSGESHLANARCCLAFLLEYQAKGLGRDDRYKETQNETT